ncbi:MAG: hypothetical protein AAF587_15175 [Bacteroidota bacterium]
MTPTLRRRHQQIWMILAILLPLGFIASWMSIPAPSLPDQLTRTNPPLLQNAIQIADGTGEGIQVGLFAAPGQKEKQILIEVQQELQSASTWVYSTPAQDASGTKKWTILGLLEHTGQYRFNLPSDQATAGIVLYDGIKQEVLQTIFFE